MASLAAGAAGVLLGLHALGTDIAEPRPGRTALALTGAGVLVLAVTALIADVAVRANRLAGGGAPRWPTAVLGAPGAVAAAAVAALAWLAHRSQARHGYPGTGTAWLATGAAALTLAMLGLLALTGLRSFAVGAPRTAGWRWAATALALSGVVAVVTVGGLTVSGGRGADASTAPAVAATARPAAVTHLAWRVGVPGLLSVVAAGAGVVARTGDGVLALDGTTGAVRWRWRRPGAVTTALLATTDGSVVALRIGPPGGAIQLVVLDAGTGRERFTETGGWAAQPLLVTDTAIVSSDAIPADPATGDVSRVRAATRYRAWSVLDGRELWTYRIRPPCRPVGEVEQPGQAAFPTASTLVLTTVCLSTPPTPADQQTPGTLVVTALDATTGRDRWEHRVPIAGSTTDGAQLVVSTPPDGRMIGLSWLRPDFRRDGLLVAADTGAVLHDSPSEILQDGLRAATRTATGASLDDALTGRPVPGTQQGAACALRGLALATGVVCADALREEPAPALGRILGAATVHAGPLTGPVTALAVDLGGPFYADSGADPLSAANTPQLIAVAGAVVVAPALVPLDGGVAVLAGLR